MEAGFVVSFEDMLRMVCGQFEATPPHTELLGRMESGRSDWRLALYTSGTTGQPKGVVHDTGGYLVAGDYWTVWPSVWHANAALAERGEMVCFVEVRMRSTASSKHTDKAMANTVSQAVKRRLARLARARRMRYMFRAPTGARRG